MKRIICTVYFALLGFIATVSAQSFDVPKNYHFDAQTNYAIYEADVVKAADWLQHVRWGTEPQKTDATTQFILKWAQGVPYVTIELKQAVMELSDANPQLGFIYMAQYCKYAIQHPRDFDSSKASIDALKAVTAKYRSEPTHKRDNEVEKLIELEKNNELESWVTNDFSF